MAESFDFTSFEQQVRQLYNLADKCLYKSVTMRRVDENLIKQGNEYLRQAQDLIGQNLQPILTSINPSDVASALTAAAAAGTISSRFANQAINCVSQAAKVAAKEAVEKGAEYGAGEFLGELALGLGISIGILAGCVAAYLLFKGMSRWFDRLTAQQRQSKALAAKYYDPQGRPYKYVPFGTPMTPRVAR